MAPPSIDLARFPRVPLGHGPTPLEPLDRLAEHLGGARIWVKRDDCTGLALGGNKVRKLEFLLGEALAEGADTVVTVGAVQSNHARQTAAAAARLGLACELVLPRLVERSGTLFESNGNVLLDRLFGARLHIVDDAHAARERTAEILDRIRGRGGTPAFIPVGGSNATGSLGYVRAVDEFAHQCAALDLDVDRLFVAASSGGTVAGLATGWAALGAGPVVTGVAVYSDAETTREEIAAVATHTAARIGIEGPGLERVAIVDDQLGPGYGMPTEAMHEAIALAARLEGLVLDPVYTGKAMAGLIDHVRRGVVGTSETVVFWHTGGAPALFAYG